MAYRDTELGLLVRLHPRQAMRRILAAYRAEAGVATRAAIRLGVEHSTLLRWVGKLERRGLDVRERIEEVREAAAA